jgi:hypothetical protein
VRTFFVSKSQLGLDRRGNLPSQPAQQLAHGVLSDAETPCDFALTVSLRFELLDQAPPRNCHSWPTSRIAIPSAQGGQAALLKASLMPAHRSCRTVESPSHLKLLSPTLYYQTHDGMGFRHAISQRILCQNHPEDEDHAMTLLGFQQAPIIDNAGVLRVPSIGEQIIPLNKGHTAGQYPRWEKADRFGCAPGETSDGQKCPKLGKLRGSYVRSSGVRNE